MAGNIGSLGGVSFDILAENKTAQALEEARSNFVITAGDIMKSIDSVASKLAEFDEMNANLNADLGVTALTLGMDAETLRGWANEASSTTDPIEEMAAAIDVLARAGIRNHDSMMSTLGDFDLLADAVGESTDKLTSDLIPAFRALNIPLTDVGDYVDRLAYTFNATNIPADEFSSVMQRMGPELGRAGVSLDDVTTLLVLLKDRGYEGRNAMQELTSATGKSADANKDGIVTLDEMLAKMGISREEFDRQNQALTANSKEYAAQAAQIRNENVPITDQYNTTIKNTMLGLGDLTTPITSASSLFGDLASTISTVAVPAMILFPAKFAAMTGYIEGLISGMGSELSSVSLGAGGTIAGGIGAGIALGLAGVWTLDKLGILSGLSSLGQQIESSPIGSVIMDALKVVLAPIGSIGAAIIDIVRGDFAKIPEDMAKPFEQAGEAIGRNMDRIREAFGGIGSVATGGVSSLGSAVQDMIGKFAGMGSIGGYASSAFGNIGSAFNSMAGQVKGVFSQMFSSIKGMIDSVAGGFYNAGQNIITSIVNGIVAAAGGIVSAIAGALNQVRALFPFSPAKEGPLAETPNWGTWMSSGMEAAGPEVAAAASTNLAAPAAAGVAGGVAGAGGGGGGSVASGGGSDTYNFNVTINGANKVTKEMADEIYREFSYRMASTRKQRGMRT